MPQFGQEISVDCDLYGSYVFLIVQMERYVVLVFTLLCIYVTFSYAEETKELTISVPHLESQPNTVCGQL